MKFVLTPFFVLCLCSCATLSIPESVRNEIDSDLQKYANCKDYKAYAVAVDNSETWVSGWSYGYPNQALANKRALLECETRKFILNVEAKCTIIHEGSSNDKSS